MFVWTSEGFWVRKDWITEISYSKSHRKYTLYTKQEGINYTTRTFKNDKEAEKWLEKEFGIKEEV